MSGITSKDLAIISELELARDRWSLKIAELEEEKEKAEATKEEIEERLKKLRRNK